ncbi:MAG TPA: VOC family protein [Chloroflexi bacterium]|nr:VOC family protein [Chloroflexota bacterium]
MAKLNPYLVFNGNCQEAMEFYTACLGGELELNTVAGSPVADQMPAEMQDKILHSMLASGDIVIMAADMVGEEGYKPGNTIALNLLCESTEELERLFSSLSEGGVVTQPVGDEFFGTFGALTDRFGVGWMLLYLGAEDTTA